MTTLAATCDTAPRMTRPAPLPAHAVADLARQHGRLVFTAAYRILGDATQAEDVQQDVFLRLLDARTDDVVSWPAWLTAAATRLAIDHIRRQQRWRRLWPGWLLQQPQTGDAADGLTLHEERARRLATALARLKPREAECFALRFVQGHDIPAIATALAITPNHASVLLHRATRALETQLRDGNDEVQP